jgi:regulator of protease activity HflC (stomatin/prohibitin superfamily)
MVDVAGVRGALDAIKGSVRRTGILGAVAVVGAVILYSACTVKVLPNEYGVEQRRFGFKTGIADRVYAAGLYIVGPGTTMHTFSREIHVLDAMSGRGESGEYAKIRDRVLGSATHRNIEAINVQTSDGYAVTADVTLLYSIENPVQIAKEFGWGTLYVDSFILNTFRNGILTTLGKMNAESFYDEAVRIAAVSEAESTLEKKLKERGFKVEKLLLRNYFYVPNYEKSLHDKKVAVQLAVKNKKESLVNEEKAKLRQIESKGNAAITIAESEVNAKISKIKAEADLYASQVRAKGDKEINVAAAEAKRLKADALNSAGGRYVVALETAKMFENIEGAVMTPEQYIAFIRNAWAVIGVNPGGPAPAPPSGGKK